MLGALVNVGTKVADGLLAKDGPCERVTLTAEDGLATPGELVGLAFGAPSTDDAGPLAGLGFGFVKLLTLLGLIVSVGILGLLGILVFDVLLGVLEAP